MSKLDSGVTIKKLGKNSIQINTIEGGGERHTNFSTSIGYEELVGESSLLFELDWRVIDIGSGPSPSLSMILTHFRDGEEIFRGVRSLGLSSIGSHEIDRLSIPFGDVIEQGDEDEITLYLHKDQKMSLVLDSIILVDLGIFLSLEEIK